MEEKKGRENGKVEEGEVEKEEKLSKRVPIKVDKILTKEKEKREKGKKGKALKNTSKFLVNHRIRIVIPTIVKPRDQQLGPFEPTMLIINRMF